MSLQPTDPQADDDAEETFVCHACVGESFLSNAIQQRGEQHACSYCHTTREAISIEAFADEIEGAFARHYRRTSTEPSDYEYMLLRDKEGSYNWDRHGEPVIDAIASAAEVDEEIAEDVQRILEDRHADFDSAAIGEECDFDGDSYYEEKRTRDTDLQQSWVNFERGLKTQSRYFNREAEAVLTSLFEGLTDHKTIDGKHVVTDIGPRKKIESLYRARVFQSDIPLEKAMARPDLELGPAPTDLAANGRMNARGISVFYGALTPEVALAEIRPPVGSRVMIGKFTVVRPLKILDVEGLQSVLVRGSIFDSSHITRLQRAKFLRRLSDRITRPVMPSDEPSDYLITQAIADYLAGHIGIDGILYPSAQVGSGKKNKNVVLFHPSSRVEALELPPGTELSAHTYTNYEDGPEPDYWVSEEVPDTQPALKPATFMPHVFPELLEEARDFDPRVVTLQLDLDSLEVREIEAVSFKTSKHAVRRHRFKRSDFDSL
ncbi:RES domain-containing protein [Bradyrhizobium sp. SZCCHNR2035]|uniref:RES domain-containing protein n=1 Tax=Bradyrhizobium sp. SZCCHNR2035 TaxID=3057386 RepID=UPI002916E497|nr:RES domain-containing protein [Bradyrhizobium sp. SZCCHNR2035]